MTNAHTPNAIPGRKGFAPIPLAARMQNYEPVPESGCWIWMGDLSTNGYGRIHVNGRAQQAHRVSWEMANGRAMPPELDACHTCDVGACINPAHIWPGTPTENYLDSLRKGRAAKPPRYSRNALKTHCYKGHEFTAENTSMRMSNGKRYRKCLICEREYHRARAALATLEQS